jgi:hypothetical protein
VKFVAISDDNQYLTPRIDTAMIQKPSSWSADLYEAKLFHSKRAAVSSANQCKDKRPFIVFKVEYVVGGPV